MLFVLSVLATKWAVLTNFCWCLQSPQVNVDTASRNVAFYVIMSQITTRPLLGSFSPKMPHSTPCNLSYWQHTRILMKHKTK